jgi:hypothetical protein
VKPPAVHPLSLASPLADLAAAASTSKAAIARARGVDRHSQKDGPTLSLATLSAAAKAVGFELVIGVRRVT